jgi:hypothetical protein
VAVVAVLAVALGACDDKPVVGAPCWLAAPIDDPGRLALTSPSLDCVSHVCLGASTARAGDDGRGMCTATCDVDDDCEGWADTACAGGFVCAVPTVTGDFCCRRLCVCADDAALLPAPQPVPIGCDPELAENTCANLPGR